jgi:hypothetical protein
VWGCQESCGDKCQHANDVRPTPYGSIAFGTRGAQGISWNQGTWATADNLAIANCGRYGTDCKVVYHFQNACAALAVAKGGHYEAGTGDTAKKAEANATAACQQHWGTCTTDISACSFAAATASKGSNPPPQPHATSWGAIAYSAPDMQSGWAISKNDQALAESEAMKMCTQRGKACAVKAVFNKQCGALARDRSFVGFGTAADQREAQQKALDACTKDGGARCVLYVSFCSL